MEVRSDIEKVDSWNRPRSTEQLRDLIARKVMAIAAIADIDVEN